MENTISIDVEDMYPSLPREEVLKVVSRLINLPQFRREINRDFTKLCEFCRSQIYFRLEGRYFEQKDGIFIGSPSSPPFAELYLGTPSIPNFSPLSANGRLWVGGSIIGPISVAKWLN